MGVKMAVVAMRAPGRPAVRQPMKVAVMTTGPGVIRPIATASMNWRLVSQWCWATTPSRRNGTMARPLPKMNAPALRKNRPRDIRTPAEAVRGTQGAAAPASAAAGGMPAGPERRSQRGGGGGGVKRRAAGGNKSADFPAGTPGENAAEAAENPQPRVP